MWSPVNKQRISSDVKSTVQFSYAGRVQNASLFVFLNCVARDHLYLTRAFEAFFFDCYDFPRSLNAQKESQDVFSFSQDPLPVLAPSLSELSSLGICSVLSSKNKKRCEQFSIEAHFSPQNRRIVRVMQDLDPLERGGEEKYF